MKARKVSPAKVIAASFLVVILVGALLLLLPISAAEGVRVSFVDALFTSTSAVCVTGLIAVDTADTYSVFGQVVVALLIQIGGLGVTSLGVGIILTAGGRLGFREHRLIREAWNLDSFKGIASLVRSVLLMTLFFESVGALLSFLVFRQDFPLVKAAGISLFHSVAAFNNAGFDILGGLQNLIPYQDNVLLNLTTSGLIIAGGIGFLVILDVLKKRSFRRLTLHSKAVLFTSAVLLLGGTLLLKYTEDITWLGAFFQSVSARTAGFSTFNIGEFTNAGILILTILMFIGASPGSTGGGIKTTTLFVLVSSVRSMVSNQHCQAFRRRIPSTAMIKANVIVLLASALVLVGTFLLCLMEPECTLAQCLFEVTSAFGTVGLSTGITPQLGDPAKLLLIVIMYIGRLGPLTVASLWFGKQKPGVRYTEEMITIG